FLDLAECGRVHGQVRVAGHLRGMRHSRGLRRAHRIRLHRRSFVSAYSARRADCGSHSEWPGQNAQRWTSAETRAQSVSRDSARGSAGGGGRVALDFFFGEKTPEYFAKESARQSILQLDAREAPAGDMEVVLGPGWPGVLIHEAVGHGLEADFNRKQTSAFAGLIGKKVASEKCTVVDNGVMPWRRGSLNVDDEGHATQETVLIEKGILKGYLSDKLSARLMGMADTGNGRRESYEHIPMPRMTNTYLL